MPQEKPPRPKRREPAHGEDDGERLCCEECGESFNVDESPTKTAAWTSAPVLPCSPGPVGAPLVPGDTV
jgi:hypothetical protein